MARLKASPPSFRGDERPEEKLDRIDAYLREQKRELDFVLANLGAGNMNGAGLVLTVKSADGKTTAGGMGALGGGVGLASGTASVTVKDGEARLTVGETCLRVTGDGVFIRKDGAWTPV